MAERSPHGSLPEIKGTPVPGWLGIKDKKELDDLSSGVMKVVAKVTLTSSDMLTPEVLAGAHGELVNYVAEEPEKERPDEPAVLALMAAIAAKHQQLSAAASPVAVDFDEVVGQLQTLAEIGEDNLALAEMQAAQMRAGYTGLVAAEAAQAPFSPEWFDTQTPAWYAELDRKGKAVIRQRLFLMRHAFIKRRDGMFELDALLGNREMRIDRSALDTMWEEMPGFRYALGTMMADLFTLVDYVPTGTSHIPPDAKKTVRMLRLTEQGVGILNEFGEYRAALAQSLAEVLIDREEVNGNLLPSAPPKDVAEAAVSAAWNLIFCTNVIETADGGSFGYREIDGFPPAKRGERAVKNSEVWAEQPRASASPGQKARSKFDKREAGTDERFLGNLGEWLVDRFRAGGSVEDGLKRGKEILAPELLMNSLFDGIDYVKDDETLSLGEALLRASLSADVEKKTDIRVTISVAEPDPEAEDAGAQRKVKRDFAVSVRVIPAGPETIDLKNIKPAELWAYFVDDWDSAAKIYKAIAGQFSPKDGVDQWAYALSNAFSKLRKGPLGPIYRTDGPLLAAIAGTWGLEIGTDEPILEIRDERQYDQTLGQVLKERRLLAGLARGARARFFKFFHGIDAEASWTGWLKSVVAPDVVKKRARLRMEATRAAARESTHW